MKIFLVRHGEADAEIEGNPLTEKGILEANSVAEELLKYDFKKIYYSDLLRAKETADPYLKLNKDIKSFEDSRLREIYRVIIGGPIKEGTSPDREINDRKRADEIFNEMIKNEGNILVFCHGNIIRYFLNKALKSNDNLWESMKINNGSISILGFKKESLKIEEINLINHLPRDVLSDIPDSSKKEIYLP